MKTGDKIRVKTEQQLLTEGWQADGRRLRKGEMWLWTNCLGYEYKIKKISKNGQIETTDGLLIPVTAVEQIAQTLHEYICGLPLYEMAIYFIQIMPTATECYYYSALTNKKYQTADEVIKATVEMLQSPKI